MATSREPVGHAHVERGGRCSGSTLVTDQLPYGDFRPGRFGLLLADVEPLAEPVPFKGGQGLSRSVDPALLMARRGDLK